MIVHPSISTTRKAAKYKTSVQCSSSQRQRPKTLGPALGGTLWIEASIRCPACSELFFLSGPANLFHLPDRARARGRSMFSSTLGGGDPEIIKSNQIRSDRICVT